MRRHFRAGTLQRRMGPYASGVQPGAAAAGPVLPYPGGLRRAGGEGVACLRPPLPRPQQPPLPRPCQPGAFPHLRSILGHSGADHAAGPGRFRVLRAATGVPCRPSLQSPFRNFSLQQRLGARGAGARAADGVCVELRLHQKERVLPARVQATRRHARDLHLREAPPCVGPLLLPVGCEDAASGRGGGGLGGRLGHGWGRRIRSSIGRRLVLR
mmetsp:Transcript_33975/g.74325  ORF Transcript_33975/g.74325 Transcript_33975/m.74325 type:complete len:213 (+) Transcript_33975:1252-1890(+)